jgi:hypothetical protein
MEIAARFELKYVLPLTERDALLARFVDRFQPDTLGGPTGRYPVVSLYCDTLDRKCHWDAWRGVPSRRKLRLRLYGTKTGETPAATFLEIKHRDGGEGAKRRVPLPTAQACAFVNGGEIPTATNPATARIIEEARRLVVDEGFQPACVIRYNRHAYRLVGSDGTEQLRITFDHDIHARFDDLTPHPEDDRCTLVVLEKGLCLMEVKGATAAPYDFAAYLSARGVFPRSFSKYSESVRQYGATPTLSASCNSCHTSSLPMPPPPQPTP